MKYISHLPHGGPARAKESDLEPQSGGTFACFGPGRPPPARGKKRGVPRQLQTRQRCLVKIFLVTAGTCQNPVVSTLFWHAQLRARKILTSVRSWNVGNADSGAHVGHFGEENTCFGRPAAVFPRNPRIFARGRSRILLGQRCHRGAPASPRQTPTESRFPPKNCKRTLKNAFRGEIRSSLKRLGPVLTRPEGASMASLRKHALGGAGHP